MTYPTDTQNRSVVRRNHALIARESRVPSDIPGWEGSFNYVIVSRAMGAGFSQYLFELDASNRGSVDTGNDQWFLYMANGQATCQGKAFNRGDYAYFPPHTHIDFVCTARGTQLLIFRKTWEPHPSYPNVPPITIGHEKDAPEAPFPGAPGTLLKTLLPLSGWDMAVNIFTFDAGATLPIVETHVMEHGMYFLDGGGVYRLGEDWYPVKREDSLWIAPYCPQWFIAAAPGPARYIYYKNVNRLP